MTSLSPISATYRIQTAPILFVAVAQRAILVKDIREKVIAMPEILMLAHLEMMMSDDVVVFVLE
jgi:hypothetical protein